MSLIFSKKSVLTVILSTMGIFFFVLKVVISSYLLLIASFKSFSISLS